MRQYGHEFTIRAGRPSGTKTELTKIVEGWGDYFFYGFCDGDEVKLSKWILGDLKAFRLYVNRELLLNSGRMPGARGNNTDGSSFFYAFQYHAIPNFVVAESAA
jgi:hypothetical protein